MADIRRTRFDALPPRNTTEYGTREGQSVEANEVSLVKNLNGKIVREGKFPVAVGTHGDVWQGRWKRCDREKGGKRTHDEKLTLKALRAPKLSVLDRELSRWAGLRHRNVLPFYGVVTDIETDFYIVSPWQDNKNLLFYIKNKPEANKHNLLCGSAAGLAYLHSRGIVHDNVKCKSVLVSRKGEPRVYNFGMANIVEENTEGTISRMGTGGGVGHSVPGLIENDDALPTTKSDTYSFAMLILECITEKTPFSGYSRDAKGVCAMISKGECPSRPDGPEPMNCVSDGLWALMMRCWSTERDDRPTMEEVHRFFLSQTQHDAHG